MPIPQGDHKPAVPLEERTQTLLRGNDWFWVVTGVHQGGGLDCSLIIRKKGPPMLPQPSPAAGLGAPGLLPAASSVQGSAPGRCAAGCVDATALAEVCLPTPTQTGAHHLYGTCTAPVRTCTDLYGTCACTHGTS